MVEIRADDTKAIIWDLDGTMLRSNELWPGLVRQVATAMGLPRPDDKSLSDNFHGSLAPSLAAVLELPEDDQMHAATSHFLAFQEQRYETIEPLIFQDAHHLALRAKAAGLAQYIVSNREHNLGYASPVRIAARTPLNAYIEYAVAGDDSEYRKPRPQVLDKLLGKFGLQASELVIIGDQHVDAELAVNLQTRGIIVARGEAGFAHAHRLEEGYEDFITVVSSLDQVSVV